MGEGSGISFSKKQEREEIRDGITLMPTEVNMRHLPGCLFEIDQKCCERVGNRNSPQDAMPRHARR